MADRKGQILLSAIMLCGALLAASLTQLGVQVVTANTYPQEMEHYGGLYAASMGEFVEPAQKTVYFTFDDGPSKNTEALLDILLEENVKATFFVCAQAEDKEFSEKMLRRMRDEGHTIALHTYTHNYGDVYTTLEGYLADLERIDQFVYQATGVSADLVRFPGGSATRNAEKALLKSIADEVTRRGYVFYDWTVVSGDDGATAAPVEQITANIIDGISGKQVEIVLCHDNATPTTTPAAVQAAIRQLREEGYAFDRLTPDVPPVQFVYAKK